MNTTTAAAAATLPAVTSIHFACGLLPLTLVATSTFRAAFQNDARAIKAEVEMFNNATFVGRTAVAVNHVRTRAFMFKATRACAEGIARVTGLAVYSTEGDTYIAL